MNLKEINNMDLTIAILTYNSSSTIIKCLKSLNKQTWRFFKVIIIDDNSDDSTLQLIDAYKFKLSFPITIYQNGSRNISTGRNIAINNCQTKYLSFMDSDAYAEKDWAKCINNNFSTDKQLAILGGSEIIVHNNKFSEGIAMNDQAINNISNDIWKTKGLNFAINIHLLKNIYFNKKFIHNDETEFIFRAIRSNKKLHYKYDKNMIVYHYARSSIKKYLNQVYKYGIWRVFFSFYSKKFRAIDYVPSILIFTSIMVGAFQPIFILTIFIFSLLETVYIFLKVRPNISYIPYNYLGWLIKNIGWGFGIIVGVITVIIDRKLINSLKYNIPSIDFSDINSNIQSKRYQTRK